MERVSINRIISILILTSISTYTCNGANNNNSLSLSNCDTFESEDSQEVNIWSIPPKIVVSAAPGHLKIDEDNSTYVIEAIGIEIRIDCWAPYPIDIDFKGHLVRHT